MGRAHAPVDACDAGISIRSGANPLTQPAWAQLMVAFLQLWQCHVACSCHICRMHAPAQVQMVLQAYIIPICAPNPKVNPTSYQPFAAISVTISATAANLVTRLHILQATSCEVALCSCHTAMGMGYMDHCARCCKVSVIDSMHHQCKLFWPMIMS